MRATLRILLEEILLEHNAEVEWERKDISTGGKTVRVEKVGYTKNRGKNKLVATMRYPRSGAPTILSTKDGIWLTSQADKATKTGTRFDRHNDFWESLLFKEVVNGETRLQIKIVDLDSAGKLESFILEALGAAGKAFS